MIFINSTKGENTTYKLVGKYRAGEQRLLLKALFNVDHFGVMNDLNAVFLVISVRVEHDPCYPPYFPYDPFALSIERQYIST